MSINGPHIRSEHWRSIDLTVPTGGVTAGQMDLIHNMVGIWAETKDAGETCAFIYQADAILVPKGTATADVFDAGDYVYFDHADANVNATSGSNTLCGRALEAVDADDTEILIDLEGHLAA